MTTSAAAQDKRAFPNCPFCRWRPAMKFHADGQALLTGLLTALGRPLTRIELTTPISDYKCPKCKSIVVVRVGDLLRN
jgi:ribosomal protein L37AE/L43A